jgi:hypothetical protein
VARYYPPVVASSENMDLSSSPAWYPLKVETGGISLIGLSERDYAAASFLDERLLQRHPSTVTLPIGSLAAAGAQLPARAYYLFHLGHVGSTLISRLMGAHPSLFCLREPALLRAQARSPASPGGPQLSLRTLLALLARTWRRDQLAVIKATSIVNEIAGRIFAESEVPRALLIYANPLAYLRGILGGPNSRIETKAMAPDRLRRLALQFPETEWSPAPRSEGEWIAGSWLCEMSALEDLSRRYPRDTQWLDFDTFLRNPAAGLAAILAAVGVLFEAAAVESIVRSPIMRQYSKAPEHSYDSALRTAVLESADREHGAEIRQGMKWLEAHARRDPAIQRVIDAGRAAPVVRQAIPP